MGGTARLASRAPLHAAPRAAVRPFAFVGRRHPLHEALAPLRAQIAADPGLRPTGAAGEIVRADVRAAPDPTGGWRLERLYWSVQRADPAAPGGLRARTLAVDRRRGRDESAVFDFPADPKLPAAARPDGPVVAGAGGAPVQVLRYIPLRRITFRAAPGAGAPAGAGAIGKIKAPSGLGRAHDVLEEVVRAAAGRSFAVPRSLGVDRERGVMFQQLWPGRPLAEIAGGPGTDAALHRFGAMHRELHALDADVARADEERRAASLAADVAWIGCALPQHAGAVGRVHRWLREKLRPGAEDAFCHGDLTPAQIVCDGAAWAVVDLDDAHRGDPYAEIGAVVASLEHELVALAYAPAGALERARDAYLAGYGGPLDERRLLAHRVRAEVVQLANRLRKDRVVPGEPERVLARLRSLTGA